jgi:hypothetical protein
MRWSAPTESRGTSASGRRRRYHRHRLTTSGRQQAAKNRRRPDHHRVARSRRCLHHDHQPSPGHPAPSVDIPRPDHRCPRRRPDRAGTGPPPQRSHHRRPQRRRGLATAAPPPPRDRPRHADRHSPARPVPQTRDQEQSRSADPPSCTSATRSNAWARQPAPPRAVGHDRSSCPPPSAHRPRMARGRNPRRQRCTTLRRLFVHDAAYTSSSETADYRTVMSPGESRGRP